MNEWDEKSLQWELPEAAAVFEIGAYEGRWAAEMLARHPHILLYGFEPQPWACERLRGKFEQQPRFVLAPYALGTITASLPMGEWGTDGCSFVRSTREKGTGQMVEMQEALNNLGLGAWEVELALMNIEGYEFELLPYMFQKGLFFKRLMIQFHPENSVEWGKYFVLRRMLAINYNTLWDYRTTLSAWELKQ